MTLPALYVLIASVHPKLFSSSGKPSVYEHVKGLSSGFISMIS
jgi:hypothetical protein